MKSSKKAVETLTSKNFPPKDIIFNHIFSLLPNSAITMSAVSRYWNEIFRDRKFWEQVLIRDYGFNTESLKPLDPIALKKSYVALANLENSNPAYARWYQENVIKTGADFSILYRTKNNIRFDSWFEPDNAFILALKVSNFVLAKELLLEKRDIDQHEFDQELLMDMALFGNAKAVHWLETVGINRSNTAISDSDIDSDAEEDIYLFLARLKQGNMGEIEEPGELSSLVDGDSEEDNEEVESASSRSSNRLLKSALMSTSLDLIKSEIARSTPEEILYLCSDIISDDDGPNLPAGLCVHGSEIIKLLITPCMAILQRDNASLEEAQQVLYPLAAFSGKVEIFKWLKQELETKFKSSSAHQELLTEANDSTLIIALTTGKLDFVKWLIDPEGGKFNKTGSLAFNQNILDQVMKSRNPTLVQWFMSEQAANIKIKSATDLDEIMHSLALYPELSVLLHSYLQFIKEGVAPALSEDQLEEIFYIAAENNNIPAMSLLLDPSQGNLSLSSEDFSTLTNLIIREPNIAMLEYFSNKEHSKPIITINSNFLSAAIRSLPNVTQDENNLPALIHWLIDEKHGNLPVDENDLTFVKDLSCQSEITKNLVQDILTRALIAQNKPKPLRAI